ncbi:NAD(P)-binding protein [Aspergillus ellipticus CBS 707.79]|uniref:NAD(P)-binding protein n=1 Tax=Aspergillus ellipticus CBS 707.79 TaxID=1448320 RepID=A0A319DNH4_9EURO|nr:NAD(P)-binding protein [Aspergillus ellipticus CBS 707.79]
MSFYNSYAGFMYRQFLVCPHSPPSSTSLAGKAGIVTGSNTGLGYQASAQLLKLGLSHLILAVRNTSKGEAAKKSLLASLSPTTKPPTIEIWEIDMANYTSIINFVERVKTSGIYFDFALLNAGVATFNYTVNPLTAHETSIQINWLSTALLTLLLLPKFDRQATTHPENPRPVISIVGSETAAWAKFKEAQVSTKKNRSLLDVLDDKSHFDMGDRYYTSKLLQQLFFLELCRNRRSEMKRSTGAVLNLVNPGFCYGSELHRTAEGAFGKVLGGIKRVIGRSTAMGARTMVHSAALVGKETDGKYLSDCRVAPFAGYVGSESGRVMQRKAWGEMVVELGKVVDVERLLAEV